MPALISAPLLGSGGEKKTSDSSYSASAQNVNAGVQDMLLRDNSLASEDEMEETATALNATYCQIR